MSLQTAKHLPVPLRLDELLAESGTGGTGAITSGVAAGLPSQRTLSVVESAQLFLATVVGYFAPDKLDALGAAEVQHGTVLSCAGCVRALECWRLCGICVSRGCV